ncbi:MAG TPA: PDZ domain-containing protein [Candidatus Polarisedimenticolaceae bacterium]|nr:PDZ domain-containing protein [Candidatus Polarisedimenticolaceae bacterium]
MSGLSLVFAALLPACTWAGPDPVGSGIERLLCVGGECWINLESPDGGREHRFTTEPRIVRLRPPAADVLQVGDVIVSVDGAPITTREGGRRLARPRAGEAMTLGIRRDGRSFEVRIEPQPGCPIGSLAVRE